MKVSKIGVENETIPGESIRRIVFRIKTERSISFFLRWLFFPPIFQFQLFSLFMTFQELSVVVEETSTFVFSTTARNNQFGL